MSKKNRPKRFWKVDRLVGSTIETIAILPAGSFSEGQMVELLRRLACEGLTRGEIVDSSKRKNARGYRPHLEVLRDGPPHGAKRFMLSTGADPHYIGSIWTEEELEARKSD